MTLLYFQYATSQILNMENIINSTSLDNLQQHVFRTMKAQDNLGNDVIVAAAKHDMPIPNFTHVCQRDNNLIPIVWIDCSKYCEDDVFANDKLNNNDLLLLRTLTMRSDCADITEKMIKKHSNVNIVGFHKRVKDNWFVMKVGVFGKEYRPYKANGDLDELFPTTILFPEPMGEIIVDVTEGPWISDF